MVERQAAECARRAGGAHDAAEGQVPEVQSRGHQYEALRHVRYKFRLTSGEPVKFAMTVPKHLHELVW